MRWDWLMNDMQHCCHHVIGRSACRPCCMHGPVLFTAIHDMDTSGAHSVEHAHREDELAAVARIQAEAFFEASPIAPLDPLLYYMFQVCIWPRCTLCLIP